MSNYLSIETRRKAADAIHQLFYTCSQVISEDGRAADLLDAVNCDVSAWEKGTHTDKEMIDYLNQGAATAWRNANRTGDLGAYPAMVAVHRFLLTAADVLNHYEE